MSKRITTDHLFFIESPTFKECLVRKHVLYYGERKLTKAIVIVAAIQAMVTTALSEGRPKTTLTVS